VAGARALHLLYLPIRFVLVRVDLGEPDPIFVLVKFWEIVLGAGRAAALESCLLNESASHFIGFVVASDSMELLPVFLEVLVGAWGAFVFVLEDLSCHSQPLILEKLALVAFDHSRPISLGAILGRRRNKGLALGEGIHKARLADLPETEAFGLDQQLIIFRRVVEVITESCLSEVRAHYVFN